MCPPSKSISQGCHLKAASRGMEGQAVALWQGMRHFGPGVVEAKPGVHFPASGTAMEAVLHPIDTGQVEGGRLWACIEEGGI